MRILCTNDDGIHAPGLKTLEAIARALSDDVWIVAPETDQSGVSHSLSLNDPLRLREISDRHFAVKGTPTDCVIMGVRHLMSEARPDLILSGVNRGQNVAEDVSYSGTVAGAIEGTILGVPSIALSQAYSAHGRRNELKWQCAEHHGPKVVRRILRCRNRQGHSGQRQLSRLRARRRDRRRRRQSGSADAGTSQARRAHGRTRQSVLLDRVRATSVHAEQRHGSVGHRQSPHRDHAAAPRHDGRADTDALRACSSTRACFGLF